MKTHLNLSKEGTLYLILGSILFIYLIIRAYYVPFTHDEASTFYRLVFFINLLLSLITKEFNVKNIVNEA